MLGSDSNVSRNTASTNRPRVSIPRSKARPQPVTHRHQFINLSRQCGIARREEGGEIPPFLVLTHAMPQFPTVVEQNASDSLSRIKSLSAKRNPSSALCPKRLHKEFNSSHEVQFVWIRDELLSESRCLKSFIGRPTTAAITWFEPPRISIHRRPSKCELWKLSNLQGRISSRSDKSKSFPSATLMSVDTSICGA